MDVPRSIAVIDLGSTGTKVFHIAPDLTILRWLSVAAEHPDAPPYRHIDAEIALAFAKSAICEFNRDIPVDAIVTTGHGSALALLNRAGELVLPIMSYLADVPDDIARAYRALEPPFDEVLSPTNPGALTLGRQLLWQETRWPEAFGDVATILPFPQFIGYRLTGVAAAEVTSLGAQTHLWAPASCRYSSLAVARGWDRLFAPIRDARDALGPARDLALQGKGVVYCGAHDSNANYWRYCDMRPVNLLSTGTWIISFDSDASVGTLDGSRDQVSNSTVAGDPVACCRFMGGEEYARIAGEHQATEPALSAVRDIIDSGLSALPSFTDSGGPLPQSGGRGRIVGGDANMAEIAVGLAALYTAQMTAFALDQLGDTQRVVVDGVFGANPVFMAALSALLPNRTLLRSTERFGTATGAASLALKSPASPPVCEEVHATGIDGLATYHADWLEKIGASRVKDALR